MNNAGVKGSETYEFTWGVKAEGIGKGNGYGKSEKELFYPGVTASDRKMAG